MRRLLSLLLVCAFAALPCAALADRVVTLTMTGDITLGGEERVRTASFSFDTYYNQYGASYFLEKVRGLFEEDDITLINLEGTLTDSPAQEDTTKTYRFRGPTAMVQALTSSSVEVANLANNHTMDFGNQGYQSTMDTLAAYGIGYVAGGVSYVHQVDRVVSIGFVTIDGYQFEANRQWVVERIRQMKDEGVNAVVFVAHYGTEYAKNHSEVQENVSNFAIDAGADLVVMHHPHVVQGIEIKNNRYILYSLGNFCFGGNARIRAIETVIARVKLTFDNDGAYLGQQLYLYPCHTSGTYSGISTNDKLPDNNYQPVLVTGDAAQNVMNLIQADTRFRLNPYDEEKGYAEQEFLWAE